MKKSFLIRPFTLHQKRLPGCLWQLRARGLRICQVCFFLVLQTRMPLPPTLCVTLAIAVEEGALDHEENHFRVSYPSTQSRPDH